MSRHNRKRFEGGSVAWRTVHSKLLRKHRQWIPRVADIVGLALALLVCVAALNYSLPESALGQTFSKKRHVRTILPEGWAFFTRNPRESRTRLYVRTSSGRYSASNSADLRGPGWTLTGADRTHRLVEVAINQLSRQVKGDAWRECRSTIATCLRAHPQAGTPAKLHLPLPELCGDVVLYKSRPIPWEWRRSYVETRMPAQIALLNVTCEARHVQS